VREDLDEAHVVIAMGDDAPALLRAAAYAWGASVFFLLWPAARARTGSSQDNQAQKHPKHTPSRARARARTHTHPRGG
jgi:hypothetical protein